MPTQLKFRAWSPSDKKMECDKFYINQWDGKCHYTGPYHYEHEDKVVIYDCGEEEPILMQFTGLKDRKGVEIYEGDIFEIVNSSEDTVRGVVEFGIHQRTMDSGWTCDIPGFAFVINDRKTFPIVKNYKGVHDLEIMAVIGNIYENPELLNQ